MSIWLFVKSFGDLCLYYSIISGFPSLFPHGFSFLWSIVLCAAGVCAASMLSYSGHPNLRYLGLLLSAFSLLLTASLLEALLVVPAIVYTVVLIGRDTVSLEYYSFRELYIRCLWVWGVIFALISAFYYFETLSDAQIMNFDFWQPLEYGVLFALSGVYLLRQLRLGNQAGTQEQTMSGVQLAVFLGGAGGVLAALVAIERFMQDSGSSVMMLMWNLLISAIGLPFAIVSSIISLFRFEQSNDHTEPTWSSVTEEVTVPPSVLESGTTEQVEQIQQAGYPWWLALIVLALMAAALFFMMRAFRSEALSVKSEVVETVFRKKRIKPAERRSNRGKIRHYYREFLKTEQKRGTRLRTNQTSQDILGSISSETDKDAAQALREIYIIARYSDSSHITDEQVRHAKNMLKKSRRG